MSAATAARETQRSDGKLKAFEVAASTTIYKGTLVGSNAAGYLVPMSDIAGLFFEGVAYETVDNSAGLDAAKTCRVQREGEYEFVYAGGDAADAIVGEIAYAQDDQTVDEDITLKVQTYPVGEIVEAVSVTKVRIDITGFRAASRAIRKYGKRRTTAKTANYTVLADQSGQLFTNDGAAGTITFALPAGEEGMEFFFNVRAAQELRIDPNGTETISLPSSGVPGAAGKYLVADAIGESVHLMFTDGNWFVVGFTGTWTAEA
jgi:hypothetical protein